MAKTILICTERKKHQFGLQEVSGIKDVTIESFKRLTM